MPRDRKIRLKLNDANEKAVKDVCDMGVLKGKAVEALEAEVNAYLSGTVQAILLKRIFSIEPAPAYEKQK